MLGGGNINLRHRGCHRHPSHQPSPGTQSGEDKRRSLTEYVSLTEELMFSPSLRSADCSSRRERRRKTEDAEGQRVRGSSSAAPIHHRTSLKWACSDLARLRTLSSRNHIPRRTLLVGRHPFRCLRMSRILHAHLSKIPASAGIRNWRESEPPLHLLIQLILDLLRKLCRPVHLLSQERRATVPNHNCGP